MRPRLKKPYTSEMSYNFVPLKCTYCANSWFRTEDRPFYGLCCTECRRMIFLSTFQYFNIKDFLMSQDIIGNFQIDHKTFYEILEEEK